VRLLRLAPPRQAQPSRRPATGLAEWGAAFLRVSIGLFWVADAYAFGVGTGGAITLHRALCCADPDAAFRFRYDGLRLVRQAGNQYLLLARHLGPDDGDGGAHPPQRQRPAGVPRRRRAVHAVLSGAFSQRTSNSLKVAPPERVA
jgi:hypothetical protein